MEKYSWCLNSTMVRLKRLKLLLLNEEQQFVSIPLWFD